mmetsp:Transcript_4691/g.9467  ORF Transcript_4691/g.9467 Transcript_4691/m.9467 type:complete len:114 (+) Transcript_4691:506-847(+)
MEVWPWDVNNVTRGSRIAAIFFGMSEMFIKVHCRTSIARSVTSSLPQSTMEIVTYDENMKGLVKLNSNVLRLHRVRRIPPLQMSSKDIDKELIVVLNMKKLQPRDLTNSLVGQ